MKKMILFASAVVLFKLFNKNKKMKYFNINEFDSPDLPNSGINMDNDFLQMLDSSREISNIPYLINSGYRTNRHNQNVGGSPNSSHLVGKAVDIHCSNSHDRFLILKGLRESGFNRIGIYQNFIHVDNDSSKVQNVIWYL